MAVNISEILQKFQLRGAFSSGTQILGKATGTNAEPSAYPISLFLKGVFDLMSINAEDKTISYIDNEGNTKILHLGIEWNDLTEKEKSDIVDNIKEGTLETVLTQLSGYVEAERIRVSAEQTRVQNENTRQSNESIRLSNETARQSNESTRQTNETARKSNETTRQSNESVRQSNENTRKTNEATRVQNEITRIKEVDDLVKRLNEFSVTGYERRLYYLESNATLIGTIVGEEDEIDDSVWITE